MDFSKAIEQLKSFNCICREHWGKKEHVRLEVLKMSDDHIYNKGSLTDHMLVNGDEIHFILHISKDDYSYISAFTPSVTDMLADDWQIHKRTYHSVEAGLATASRINK